MLDIKNISSTLGGKVVLNNVSLTVRRGEIAVLLGSSGVGKSTLLRVLNNLEPFQQGTVLLNGNMVDLKSVNRHHAIGMVFQQYNLFDHLTVLENITIVLEKLKHTKEPVARKIALELLAAYRLEELAMSYPIQLSGGQKQRLAIARTVALKPEVICFDEPTSALDPSLTNFVAQNIQQLAQQGYIVIVATHDTMLLEKLSCTINLMHKGTIVETAASSDYWQHKTKYPQLHAFIDGNITI